MYWKSLLYYSKGCHYNWKHALTTSLGSPSGACKSRRVGYPPFSYPTSTLLVWNIQPTTHEKWAISARVRVLRGRLNKVGAADLAGRVGFFFLSSSFLQCSHLFFLFSLIFFLLSSFFFTHTTETDPLLFLSSFPFLLFFSFSLLSSRRSQEPKLSSFL